MESQEFGWNLWWGQLASTEGSPVRFSPQVTGRGELTEGGQQELDSPVHFRVREPAV